MSIKEDCIKQAKLELGKNASAMDVGKYAGKLTRAKYESLVKPISNAKLAYMYNMKMPHTIEDLEALDNFDRQIKELQISTTGCIFASYDRPQLEQLLLAVQRVFPGESRFDTALRYIREAESNVIESTSDPKQNCEVIVDDISN